MEKVDERRLFERIEARFPAKFQYSRGEFGSQVMLEDASARGVRFSTRERLYPQDNVTLEISLPDGMSPMVLRGQVLWSKNSSTDQWEVGLKFHNISLMNMSRLYSHAVGVGWKKPA